MKKNKNYKAMSLVELLVSMALFGILVVMLLQSLFLNIKLSTQINIRARVRSDLDEIQTLIERDIRNAEAVVVDACFDAGCYLKINGRYVRWQRYQVYTYPNIYNYYISRFEGPTMAGMTQTYISSPMLSINRNSGLNFTVLYTPSTSSEQKFVNVIVTIKAESNVTTLGCQVDVNNDGCKNSTLSDSPDIQWVDDQVRQFSVSTRNYIID